MVKLQKEDERQHKIMLLSALVESDDWKKGNRIKAVPDKRRNIALIRGEPEK